jgi:hypothetical protein
MIEYFKRIIRVLRYVNDQLYKNIVKIPYKKGTIILNQGQQRELLYKKTNCETNFTIKIKMELDK